ncbi:MAG: hypothetical protein AVDCRST_MAG77-5742 [uncultured Chloroflexi bacterium]|uniref:PreQ0 transporter YhhQ n=1 Tax=uncultured Chloroflexota bacterium TaxID=166587 RepID=A0A6J4KCH4_9CHLR|nr:MAG: hypothetical protein AVDCRST_MAG77-5742 [uncultured Chloroflexota bacterium]
MNQRPFGVLALLCYVATIFAANWSLAHLGSCSGQGPCTVPVWPGIVAPSGVLWAGLAFTLRDLVQDSLGRVATVVAIAAGAVLSALVSPQFAVASGTAFLLSELADFAIYTPLRARNWLAAVFASNIVGLVADSALFLLLAFGSLDFLAGQVIGKTWMTLLAVALLWFARQRRVARPASHPV